MCDYFDVFNYVVVYFDVDLFKIVYWGFSMFGGNVICVVVMNRSIVGFIV